MKILSARASHWRRQFLEIHYNGDGWYNAIDAKNESIRDFNFIMFIQFNFKENIFLALILARWNVGLGIIFRA